MAFHSEQLNFKFIGRAEAVFEAIRILALTVPYELGEVWFSKN